MVRLRIGLFYAFLVGFVCLLPRCANASHIVGGELGYTYLGNNQYQITLKLYRDCNSQTAYDNPAFISVFNSSNVQVQELSLNFPGSLQIANNTGNICLTVPPGICVEQAIYTTTVTLPPIAGGYTFVYQRCCRNVTAMNIDGSGNDVGTTMLASIPDPAAAANNNSPFFNNFPPTCICVNQPLVFDHAATDPDGDQLVYSFFAPLEGGGPSNGTCLNCTTPNPAAAAPYTAVPYTGGYTFNNPVGGSPPLSINSATGLLTGTPNTVGQFVVGVQVKEYRNGVLIGTHYRDFQFNVVQCLQTVNAILPSTMSACVGTAHTFVNNSTGATYYHWDFGVAGNADTSNLATPTFTYNTPGTYTITLTANPGLSCASTTTSTLTVYPHPVAVPSSNTPLCQGSALTLFSTTVSGAAYAWTGPNGFASAQQNPVVNNATTANSGTYHLALTANGCTSTNAGNIAVVVNPIPAAPVIASNAPVCSGTALHLTAAAVSGGAFHWTGPNNYISAQQNPNISPAAVTNSGAYTCTVTVNGCTSPSSTLNVVVNPQPAAPVLSSNGPLCAGATLNLTSTSVAGTYAWTGPNGFTSTQQNASIPNATTASTGAYTFSVTANGCSTPSTMNVVVNPIPSSTLSANSPVCTGHNIQLNATAFAAGTYAWSGPAGFTSTQQNPAITNATMAMAGTYALLVTANGCTSLPLTVNVVVNQTPAAATVTSNGPLCAGNALNLSSVAAAGVSFAWTGPAGFISSLQNPTLPNTTTANAGNYALVVTSNNCSSNPTSVNVVIHPIPTATPTNNGPVCAGQNIQLNAATYAGATYAWTGPNGFASTQQNPMVGNASANTAGTYTLLVTANGCTSPSSGTAVVVNPIPAAPVLSNDGPMCSGQTLHLIAENVTGGTFHWTGPNNYVSGQQNPAIANVPFANNGTYSATVSVLGCVSPAATTNVAISLTPVATPVNNGPLCDGETLNLTTTAVPGSSYAWTGPNGFTSTQQNPVISNVTVNNNAGVYSLTMTLNGCVGNPANTTVVVHPIPVAPTLSSNSPICAGEVLHLNALNVTGGTFSWTGPNAYTSTQQNPTLTGTTTAFSGSYTATATVSGCTSPPSALSILVKPVPVAPTVNSNAPLCAGQTLNLTASTVANATYAWSGPSAFVSTLQNPAVSNAAPSNSGNYTVTATVNGCASLPAATNATVYPIPSSAFNLSSALCTGNPVLINYAGTSAGAATYNWNFGAAQIAAGAGQGPYTVNWAGAGTYNVSLSVTENGCTSPVTVQSATVYPVPTSVFTATDSICLSDTALVAYNGTAGDSAAFNWDFGGGTADGSGVGPYWVTFASPGLYNVTMSVQEHNCTSDVTSRFIKVNPVPTAGFVVSPTVICPNQDATVVYSGTASASADFQWDFANGTVNTGSGMGPYSVHFNNSNFDALMLTVTEHGCVSSPMTHVLLVDSLPEVAFDATDTLGCAPFVTTFVNRSKRGTAYNWSFGDEGISVAENPTHTFDAGVFGVRLVVTTSSGCRDSLSKPELINVHNSPVALFSVTPEAGKVLEVKDALYSFLNHSKYADSYLWWFGDGDTSSVVSPVHLYADSGRYTVKLVAFNDIGCSDTFEVGTLYVIPNVNYFIPNTFTPNGDGMNDAFRIYGVSLNMVRIAMYDRSGEKVYESKGVDDGWDGTYKGKALNPGVYVYYGTLETLTGVTIPVHGDVTLLR